MPLSEEFLMLPKENFTNTREFVYGVLRRNILNIVLKPGEQLSENQLTSLLKVSRTPIREAIIRLVNDGLLKISPQIGTFVSKISIKHMENITFVREIIENSVLKVAIPLMGSEDYAAAETILARQRETIRTKDFAEHLYLDQQFHYIFFQAVDNKIAWDIVKRLYEGTQRERLLFLVADPGQMDYIYESHQQLLKFIKDKDIKRASDFMYEHIYRFTNLAEEMKEKYPHYLE